MYVVAYRPERRQFRVLVVTDSMDAVVVVLRRHNSKGSLSADPRTKIIREGMFSTATGFLVVDLSSDRIRNIAEGKASRSSSQVNWSGVDDATIRDVYYRGQAMFRDERIRQIL